MSSGPNAGGPARGCSSGSATGILPVRSWKSVLAVPTDRRSGPRPVPSAVWPWQLAQLAP